MTYKFFPHTDDDIRQMLAKIGLPYLLPPLETSCVQKQPNNALGHLQGSYKHLLAHKISIRHRQDRTPLYRIYITTCHLDLHSKCLEAYPVRLFRHQYNGF